MQKNILWKDETYLRSVFEIVKKIVSQLNTRHVIDKDDVVQNAMMKLINAKELGKKGGWLKQLVWNCAADSFRAHKRDERFVCYGHDFADVIDNRKSWLTKSELEQFAEYDDLTKTLEVLSPAARQVLFLLADDYTYGEIAAATKVKLGTVRSRVFYARVQAKKLLQNR